MADVSKSIGIIQIYISNTRIHQFRNDLKFIYISLKKTRERDREREIYLQNVEIAYTLKVHNTFCTHLVVLFIGKDKKYGRP